MTILAERARPRPDIFLQFQPESRTVQRSGVLYVGETTIYRRPTAKTPNIDQFIAAEGTTVSRAAFNDLQLSTDTSDHTASNPGFNIGRRMTNLDQGPVTLFTWGNSTYSQLIADHISKPFHTMHTQIKEAKGDIHEAVVFQSGSNQKMEFITVDTPASLSSDFTEVIDGTQKHVIIGALPEENWPVTLTEGVRKLEKSQTPFTLIVGEAHIRAVNDQKFSHIIYDTAEKAESLITTFEDLKQLISVHHTPEEPSNNLGELMDQARRLLKTQNIFVVAGREGFIGTSQDGKSTFVHAERPDKSDDETVSDEEYMNAFVAGVVTDGDMQTRLFRGRASASILIKPGNADQTLPTKEQVDDRVTKLESDDIKILRK